MNRYFDKVLKSTEDRFEGYYKHLQREGEFLGAFVTDHNIDYPRPTGEAIRLMVSLYVTKESKYYHSEELDTLIGNSLVYMRKSRHEDGLWDLYDCNFHSIPDTAFTTYPLMMAYLMMKQENALSHHLESLKEVTIAALNGVKIAGFHTPNHRWVIASAMSLGYRIFGDESYKATAERLLREGIDNTEFGEFAERSAGIYNLVNNRAMIYMASALENDEYLLYARRNLKMMMSYIDPDGSVFTNNSTRQDRGRRALPTEYFIEYLYMGLKENNAEFLEQANYIFGLCAEKDEPYPDVLYDFILCPMLSKANDNFRTKPYEYDVLYPSSNIARCSRDGYSFTLLGGSKSFLYFQSGSLVMNVKVGASVCEHRFFLPKEIEKTEKGYRLRHSMQSWYYLPFEKPCGTSDWWQMPNDKREKWLNARLDFDMDINEIDGGIELDFDFKGLDRVPVKFEFTIDKGGDITIDGKKESAEVGKLYFVNDGMVEYKKGEDAIVFGDGFFRHSLVEGKNDAERADERLINVYFTALTPVKRKIVIKKG